MPRRTGEQLWEVIGGAEKGGILARLDLEMDSEMLAPRLGTGAIVREWDLVGERLQFELVQGEGPPQGWVSLKIKGKDLVVKYDPGAKWRRMTPGSVLPAIPRGVRCPGIGAVPEGSRKVYEKMGPQQREPKLYALMFPGAEDEVLQGWLKAEREAAGFVEMATFEWPGHGTRNSEPFCKTLDELGDDAFEAFRDPMKTGQFILVGHSIGALIVTYVARRAWLEMGVRPRAAVILDRGPPNLSILSKEGHEMLLNEPQTFMGIFCPHLKAGSAGYQMRLADQPLDDDTRPVGWFKFPCPVHVIAAGWTIAPEWPPPGADEAWVKEMERIHRCTQDTERAREVGCTSAFLPEDYGLWREWADERTFLRLEGVQHAALKTDPQVRDILHKLMVQIVGGA